MAQVTTYTGTTASLRAQAIDHQLLNAPTQTRLIVPTQRAVQQRMQTLLQNSPNAQGFLGRPIVTFQDFASSLVEGSDDHFPLVSPTSQQLLFKRSIQLANDEALLDFIGDAANRPGFIHHVQRVIAQLKQDAIDPLAFRELIARRAHPSPFDKAVAEIYTNYQNLLLSSKTFDLQGMYWLADLACQSNKAKGLDTISTLLIDGFDDFTPSEFRLIQSVEKHISTLIFGLNYDPDPSRKDAYALVHSTHEHIQDSFETQSKDFEGTIDDAATTCQQMARTLFWRDSSDLQSLSPSVKQNIHLLPCHTVTHEVENIARTIKYQIVHDGISPSDILVILIQPNLFAHTLQSVFSGAGIPVQPVQTATLSNAATADFFLKVYEATAQWEREAIIHLLTSPQFQSLAQSPPEHVATYRHIAYRADILEGSTQWSSRLIHLSSRLQKRNERTVDTWLQHIPHFHEACISMLQDVERLKALASSIPGTATFQSHIQSLKSIRDSFSIDALLGSPDVPNPEQEFYAWDTLTVLLNDIESTSNVINTPLSRADFVVQVRELYNLCPIPERSSPEGILCLGLDDARHIQRPYVYVCGVNESAIPSPPPVNAIYAQFDQQDLATVGLCMPSHSEHAQKERLQFLRLFSIATHQLTLSWHESTQQGQLLYPSPFIQDLNDIHQQSAHEHPLIKTLSEDLLPVMNVREAMNASMKAKKALSPYLEPNLTPMLNKLQAEKNRYTGADFNEYDGVLRQEDTIKFIAQYYDPNHLFSANQIETYIDCPFRFMMRIILKISERETPALSFDRKLMGIIYHNTLEAFYTRYAGKLLEDIPLDEVLDSMTHIADEVFSQTVGEFEDTYPGIAQVERARIRQTLLEHVEHHHEEGSQGWKPSHAEVTFGEPLHSSSDSLSNPDTFPFPMGSDEYHFTGRIDRIDLNNDGAARIVDYKSSLGSISEKDIKEGRNIQLSLYAMALEKVLLPGDTCSEAIYLKIGNGEMRGRPKRDPSIPTEVAQESIALAIEQIQTGIFHPKAHEKSCKYCPNSKVCRFEEGRIAGKTQS
jgi:ATP-dependent helicase/nuclease subunit B